MTTPVPQSADGELADESRSTDRSAQRSALRTLLRNPQGIICIGYLGALLLIALCAGWLAPFPENHTNLAATNAPPLTPGHLLGGDTSGFDILSRLIWGVRQTLLAVVIVVAVSATLGTMTGLIAGYYRSHFERITGFLADAIMSLPAIVILIAMYGLTGPNLPAAMAVFGIIVAPTYYRLVRSVVLTVRNELYVDAARVAGLTDLSILGRHVLWAVRAPIIIHSAFIMAAGISIEAGISFIGLGNPTAASWGMTLQRSFDGIYVNPWGVVWPSLAICLTILAFVLLGNALSDALQSSARSTSISVHARERMVSAAAADRGADTDENGPVADTPSATAGPSAEEPSSMSSSEPPILSVRSLRIAYPDTEGAAREVVHGVDLDVHRGEIHGLVGESGSGKSQIAFSTLGILPPEAVILGGSIALDGVDLLEDPQSMQKVRGRRIGYIPQEPMSNLDPSFTIGTQLVYGLRAVVPMPKKQAEEHLRTLLERVGIKDADRVMGLYPHQISGGMAQRVLICGAIASDPDVIIADEPTTALDVTVQAEVLDLLRELSEERGLAMILVTHNLGVVADLCTTVSVMKDGKFVEHADVLELFEAPKDPYTKRLLSSSRAVEIKEIAK